MKKNGWRERRKGEKRVTWRKMVDKDGIGEKGRENNEE